ncbi:VirB3 family type IV secretion system protein [Variovorax sp. NFACC27]|uniref:Type IV secretion system protein VirB3 n=1 Tax=Variovorax gossypii TaxID=1679495 RepID=A0A3S0IZ35_9BURK|nr:MULTISPECIES: VirB3 family type IV secretion system protein [Variovorax]MDP9606107.1 type IV secretion system protein VirB3 [Variovorax paradoxus]SEF35157.1 type IV secretion system protein VirB3 [Variovorax sp. NFACC28]SEG98807.1 type IV secretion system protein VirB3 [Variovorax sp. NFACC29]SFE14214.1 type IV secretion system protein VirB3 [Variovorax sp. NFACC26]SFH19746.1 type IV secretion system protein VirB3 [Variovorax sp. NFACC27]
MSRCLGIVADPLFVGMTRPPMVCGVTYAAMMFNIVVTTESFIVTTNLAWLLAFVPVHGVLYLVCLYEPRFFDLLQLWGRTRLPALLVGNLRFWRASSYSPLVVDLPDLRGRRRSCCADVFI